MDDVFGSVGMRAFASGANRNSDAGKHDYDGFISPLMIEAFGAYMDFHRHLEDGTLRDSDNWQKGIPPDVYRKSLLRHCFEAWRALRGYSVKENVVWALCGIIFNAQGLLHELLKHDPGLLEKCREDMEQKRRAMWADRGQE